MLPTVFRRAALSPFNRRDFFGNFRRFQDNELFAGFNGLGSGYPALRVYQNDQEALVEAKLPGVKPEDVELNVEDRVLTLSGERTVEADKEGEVYSRHERFSGRFRRRLELPFEVEADQVEARFKDGLLSVKLPKAAAAKPRRIEVKAT